MKNSKKMRINGGINMAIWQFSFHIIPREKGLQYYETDRKVQNIKEIMSWRGYSIKDSSINV